MSNPYTRVERQSITGLRTCNFFPKQIDATLLGDVWYPPDGARLFLLGAPMNKDTAYYLLVWSDQEIYLKVMDGQLMSASTVEVLHWRE
jgi:hypothetical protein